MPLTFSLQFPAGRYVAASWTDKNAVEWPPHPARLCLGLVDVLHKRGNRDDLRTALDAFCALGPPRIVVPTDEEAPELAMAGYFVPQNLPGQDGLTHPRKERSFPSICLDPDRPTVFFHWPEADLTEPSRRSLAELAAGLPRFGHSSSLVLARVTDEAPPEGEAWRTLLPVAPDHTGSPDHSLRVVPYPGFLDAAEAAFQAGDRTRERADLIANAAAPGGRGNAPFRPPTSPRGRHDPPRRWQGYVEELPAAIPGTPWDPGILVLKRTGDRLDLPSTWQLTTILHRALLDRWERLHGPEDPLPEWLSGHRAGPAGAPTGPATTCHLAAFPLANVGHDHANGHLLGVGLALPRPEPLGLEPALFRLQWRKALAALFAEGGRLELTPSDKAWTVELAPEDSPKPRWALQPWRWTRPSRTWHSITPVILDRHPKPHFKKNPAAWDESCRVIVRDACARLDLPEPEGIDISPYSPLKGVPPAPQFQPPRPRPGRPERFHIHVTLRFPDKIRGPLLLGAGRYRGYGLFVPVTDSEDASNSQP